MVRHISIYNMVSAFVVTTSAPAAELPCAWVRQYQGHQVRWRCPPPGKPSPPPRVVRYMSTCQCPWYFIPGEPSHSRGAPDVPEPLTLWAQYLARYNTGKKFVRATRPVFVCVSPKTSIIVNFSSYLVVLHLWTSIGQEPFWPKTCHPYRGVTLVYTWPIDILPTRTRSLRIWPKQIQHSPNSCWRQMYY